ncbi:MAG: cell division protein ZapE [Pseudomonadales bacterium]|nr:cell division protein ZapE [Pseudomonadales bacterium]
MFTDRMGPQQRYLQLLNSAKLDNDPAQQPALQALDVLHGQLEQSRAHRDVIQGLYLWGKVGRGKTMMMDLFVASLQPEHCLRQHFHHFMASIHQQLNQLSGQVDPLKIIAKNLSKKYKVLCFDEFFVADIGDAMLLGRLLQYLFQHSVVLVATSNTEPEKLYWDGLQRQRFLPAIAAIKNATRSIHLTGAEDHRLRELAYAQNYFVEPLTEPFAPYSSQIQRLMNSLALPHVGLAAATIAIQGRDLPFLSRQQRSICFSFSQLCEGPRSHLDYIELADQFDTVVLLNVPSLNGQQYEHILARGTEDGSGGATTTGARQVIYAAKDDAVRRFIALIDEFYERGIRFYLSSAVPLEQLYTQGSLTFEFERVLSRLTEMASLEYQVEGLKFSADETSALESAS